MLHLKIILASTRPERKGPAVADWVYQAAKQYADFDTELIDLKELALPFVDEPHHPRLQQYTKQHTKDWSAKIDGADAFVFVTCEYNYGMPATLKNALDFLFKEWAFKPVAMVGYGGISGGTRSLQQLKQITNALKMFPFDGVILPFFAKQINEQGTFEATEGNEKALGAMFEELIRLGNRMKAMR